MTTINEAIPLSDRSAIVIPNGPSFTYRQLGLAVGSLQELFSHVNSPLTKGKVLEGTKQTAFGIAIPNSLEFVAVFLAITTAGRIAAPLNFNYKKSEFDFYLGDLNAQAVFVPRGFRKTASNGATAEPIVQSAVEHGAHLVEVWYDADTEQVEYEVYETSESGGEVAEDAVFASKEDIILQSGNLDWFTGSPECSDIALVLHTSGTTGRPKAVPLSHGNLCALMQSLARVYDLGLLDATYIVMPLFHVHGLVGALLSTLHSGGKAVIAPRFSARVFWDDVSKHHVTWYTAVPTIHQILLKTGVPDPVPDLRFIRLCSSALAPSTLQKLESSFNAPVVEAMGMTECAHCVSTNNLPSKGNRKPGTVGQAPPGVEIVILDDHCNLLPQGTIGEVSVRANNVTHGYLNNPKANNENFTNGYFRTGDQGYFDNDQFLILTGRIKELINRGGEKISPIELDNAMLAHPKVAEAVSFGVDDEKYGQVVHAAVVVASNQQLSAEELKSFLSEKLSAFKVPEKIYFTDHLPKTPTGKIQRRTLPKVFVRNTKL